MSGSHYDEASLIERPSDGNCTRWFVIGTTHPEPRLHHRPHAGLIDERLGRVINRPALTAFRRQNK